VKLLETADQNERPLIIVLAYTAARIDESLRLKWEDVNFERRYIRLWTKKTKDGTYRDRIIPMKDYMKTIMKTLWEQRVQETWVFFNHKTGDRFTRRPKFMRGICKRAGIPLDMVCPHGVV
jgi:integrase